MTESTTRREKKYSIWSSDVDMADPSWKQYLEEVFPEAVTDTEKERICQEANEQSLEYERANLARAELPNGGIIIISLGLWNGRHTNYEIVEKADRIVSIGNDLLKFRGFDADEMEWYCDENGDLWAAATHHDGTNYYLYRGWRSRVSKEKKVRLMENLYYGLPVSAQDIKDATVRLGKKIGKVYGWKFPAADNPEWPNF